MADYQYMVVYKDKHMDDILGIDDPMEYFHHPETIDELLDCYQLHKDSIIGIYELKNLGWEYADRLIQERLESIEYLKKTNSKATKKEAIRDLKAEIDRLEKEIANES
jgi:hypothetical protein